VAVPRISKEELKQRLEAADPESRPTILDARLKYPYEHSTIKLPGAMRIPLDGLEQASLPRDKDVVAYDSDPNELASTRFAAALIRLGFRASALKGGIPEWMAANFPTETKEAPRQAPPEPGSLKG
jgi:rhodanese-related sulfurtransferase